MTVVLWEAPWNCQRRSSDMCQSACDDSRGGLSVRDPGIGVGSFY